MADKKERMTEDKQFGIDSLTPPKTVDYFIYRLETGRWKKAAKDWMIAAFAVFVALLLSNTLWIMHEMQFVDEEYTVEATTDTGGTAVANATGEVTLYGDSEGNNQEAPS